MDKTSLVPGTLLYLPALFLIEGICSLTTWMYPEIGIYNCSVEHEMQNLWCHLQRDWTFGVCSTSTMMLLDLLLTLAGHASMLGHLELNT